MRVTLCVKLCVSNCDLPDRLLTRTFPVSFAESTLTDRPASYHTLHERRPTIKQVSSVLAGAVRITAVAGLVVALTAMAPAISPEVAAPVAEAVSAVVPGDVLLSPPTSGVSAETTSTTVESSQIDWQLREVDRDGRCRRKCTADDQDDCPCLVIWF